MWKNMVNKLYAFFLRKIFMMKQTKYTLVVGNKTWLTKQT